MKNQKSPAHRMIQLRRKTQKILSNNYNSASSDKQNYRNNDKVSSKLRSHISPKKNSLEKSTVKGSKPLGIQVNRIKSKSKDKYASLGKKAVQESSGHSFTSRLLHLVKCLQLPGHLSSEASTALNKALFSEIQCRTQAERSLVQGIQNNIAAWIHKSGKNESRKAPLGSNQNSVNYRFHSDWGKRQTEEFIDPSFVQKQSQEQVQSMSISSAQSAPYIVDPLIEVNVRPLNPQLRRQLQLNFTKVDEYRRRQLI